MLYHRWQIKSRKEVATPYWIADQLDGHGPSYYTMGSRTPTGLDTYFRSIEQAFARVHQIIAEQAFVVQLLAFSDIETQLPRYLAAMDHAGFQECEQAPTSDQLSERVWRRVPLRRWYASYQGNISASHEVLLIHQRDHSRGRHRFHQTGIMGRETSHDPNSGTQLNPLGRDTACE
jgi:hypothetical protein